MADVARTAGVSVATVSKVVNGKDGISAARTQHVKDVIADMGYMANLGAQALRSGKTGVLGILVADFEPFSTELLKGAATALKETNYELLAYTGKGGNGGTEGWEHQHVARLSRSVIDGAVIVTPSGVDTKFAVPVVAIDPHVGTPELPTVKCDSYQGAVTATQYLIKLGHTRIGFLGGSADLQSSKDREAGFRFAMRDAGLPVVEEFVGEGGYLPELSIAPAHAMLEPDIRPTAVFAANDLSAIEVMTVAEDLGLSVPRDLSVIGFDNVPDSALFHIPLTTIAQPLAEMGALALRMLTDLLTGTKTETHITMPTVLVERSSCAPPREAKS